MKYWIRPFLFFLFVATSVQAGQAPNFEQVRAQLQSQYTRTNPDGSKKVSKQFRRWEWFWEPRIMPDGTFPSTSIYTNAMRAVASAKKDNITQAKATWKELGPTAPDLPGYSSVWNGIGRVNRIAFHPSNTSVMWCGAAQGGVWKTTDGGNYWQPVVIPDYPSLGISDIAVAKADANTIYIATGDVNATHPSDLSGFPSFSYGVLKSTNGGTTWQTTGLTAEPEHNVLVARLWVDPRDKNVVIAATYSGLQRSTDGGATFSGIGPSAAFRDIISNPGNPDILYAATYRPSGNAAVYRSVNNGVNWTLVHTVPEANRIVLAATKANSSVVGFIASDARTNGLQNVYFSNDTGKTFSSRNVNKNLLGWSALGNDWQAGGQGFYDLAIAIDPTNDKNWIVGGVNSWRSTNAGVSWSLANHWVGQGAPWVHADHHFHAYNELNNILYDCNDGGIARSTDRGLSWRDISRGMRIQQYYGLAVTDMNSTVTLSGAQDNGTTRTTNGTVFQHVLDGDGMATAIDYINPNLMYASQPYGAFYASTTGGTNWRLISNAATRGESSGAWVAPVAVDPSKSGRVYIGYTNVYRSDNSGTSWVRMGNLDVNDYLRKIAVSPVDGKYIYVAFTSSMFRSTDGGTTWLPQAGIAGYIQDIKCDPTVAGKAYVALGGFSPSAKVYEILNGKATNITNVGLPNVPANAIAFQKGPLNRLYVGTDVGVYYKDEKSSVWSLYGDGLQPSFISGMELLPSSSILRVSTYGRGIWEINAEQCVAAQPTIQVEGPTTVCAGDTIRLSSPSGFAAYHWSNGSTDRTLLLTSGGESGDYTLDVEDANGCRATSQKVTVTINKTPSKPLITTKGADALRTIAMGGVARYQWSLNGTDIAGAVDREYTPRVNGVYRVTVYSAEGCSNTSEPYEFTGVTSVTSAEHEFVPVVYPNPTESNITLKLDNNDVYSVRIVDVRGKTLGAWTDIVNTTEFPVSLFELQASGNMFIVQISNSRSVWTLPLIKR